MAVAEASLRKGDTGVAEIQYRAALREGFKVYGQTALSWFRKARNCRLILVSDLEPQAARDLGAEPARDLEEALRLAARYIPPGASGWVLPQGARTLVEPMDGTRS